MVGKNTVTFQFFRHNLLCHEFSSTTILLFARTDEVDPIAVGMDDNAEYSFCQGVVTVFVINRIENRLFSQIIFSGEIGLRCV